MASDHLRGLAAQSRLHLRAWLRGEGGVRPAIVGVINVTPDSFSDGGRYLEATAACQRVDALIDDGADVIEIGGESTRPAGLTYGEGFRPVDAATQLSRVLPVIEYAARERRVTVAIDTTLAEVASATLAAGATIVNDVSCLGIDSGAAAEGVELSRVVASHGAWLVLMHSRVGSTTKYDDVVTDVAREWAAARDRAVDVGVDPARIVMDPGVGFGKGPSDNFRMLAELARFHALGHPLYVGASRKSFIAAAEERAKLPKSAPDQRDGGTIAASLIAAAAGAAALRVHEVRAMRQALAVQAAIGDASAGEGR